MKPLLALNWKLQKGPQESAAWTRELLSKLPKDLAADLVVLPVYVSLPATSAVLSGSPVGFGAQDISAEEKGAFTGEISAAMLTELRCGYAVIGHSERRQYHNETDANCNRKVKVCQVAKIIPILCVGEKLDSREAGKAVEYTLAQLSAGLEGIEITNANSVVVAYEPVWAIGTGKTATPDDAEQMGVAMREFLVKKYGPEKAALVRLLYGGSVKPDNIRALCDRKDVDGALVGGASLELDSVLKMLAALG